MSIFIFLLLCGAIAAMIGSKKGEAGMAFFIGLIFGPFGILFAILSNGNRIDCPHCRERINRKASICPHCRKELIAK
jgi:hypothetical protein